jgi:hypothetical protein
MSNEPRPDVPIEPTDELPERRWRLVYLAVIINTAVVLGLLWIFSLHFAR